MMPLWGKTTATAVMGALVTLFILTLIAPAIWAPRLSWFIGLLMGAAVVMLVWLMWTQL